MYRKTSSLLKDWNKLDKLEALKKVGDSSVSYFSLEKPVYPVKLIILDSSHGNDFAVFSHSIEDSWEKSCISHVMRYPVMRIMWCSIP